MSVDGADIRRTTGATAGAVDVEPGIAGHQGGADAGRRPSLMASGEPGVPGLDCFYRLGTGSALLSRHAAVRRSHSPRNASLTRAPL